MRVSFWIVSAHSKIHAPNFFYSRMHFWHGFLPLGNLETWGNYERLGIINVHAATEELICKLNFEQSHNLHVSRVLKTLSMMNARSSVARAMTLKTVRTPGLRAQTVWLTQTKQLWNKFISLVAFSTTPWSSKDHLLDKQWHLSRLSASQGAHSWDDGIDVCIYKEDMVNIEQVLTHLLRDNDCTIVNSPGFGYQVFHNPESREVPKATCVSCSKPRTGWYIRKCT